MYTIVDRDILSCELNGTAKFRVKIVVDTAADMPEPISDWGVGSELEVLENGGAKYVLSNAREWVQVNFGTATEGGGGGGNSLAAFLAMRNGDYLFQNMTLTDEQFASIVDDKNFAFVTSAESMFSNCDNMVSAPMFDTKNITSMRSMFEGCGSLQEIPQYDTSSVTNMLNMFKSCTKLQEIPQFDTSKVTTMSSMFYSCSNIVSMPELDMSNVGDTSSMFSNCTKLVATPTHLDLPNVTKIYNMFTSTALKVAPSISAPKVTEAYRLFNNCKSLEQASGLDFGQAELQNVDYMFENCTELKSVSNITAHNALKSEYVFQGCSKLTDVSKINLSSSKSVRYMFNGCSLLSSVSECDFSSATNASYMFQQCKGLVSININFLPKLQNASSMFYLCSKLETLEMDVRNVTSFSDMLYGCSGLKNLVLKNINWTLNLSSCKSLTVDSLIGIIAELRQQTSNITLTIGSTNKNKLTNVYVRTIEITDEMRAEDDLIDQKIPFEVCESTDDGAMLITTYAASKKWNIA